MGRPFRVGRATEATAAGRRVVQVTAPRHLAGGAQLGAGPASVGVDLGVVNRPARLLLGKHDGTVAGRGVSHAARSGAGWPQ